METKPAKRNEMSEMTQNMVKYEKKKKKKKKRQNTGYFRRENNSTCLFFTFSDNEFRCNIVFRHFLFNN